MNHYETLGISSDASVEDIKKSYRRLAKDLHPDRNIGNQEAEVAFKQIQAIYECLKDPDKKSEYDKKILPVIKYIPNIASVSCNFFGNSGNNIQTHLFLFKNDLKNGCKTKVFIKKRDLCGQCIGDGIFTKVCKFCNGLGKIKTPSHFILCSYCSGVGTIDSPCNNCKGIGVFAWIVKEVRINVPKGSCPGQQITILGEGEHRPGQEPGYLRIVLLEKQS